MIISRCLSFLIFRAALMLIMLPLAIYASQEATDPATSLNDIQISFKLDPRLTQSHYMGDIWTSPPIYTGTTGQNIVEAKADGLDEKGQRISINAEWIPSDPEMVTVSTSEGKNVKITVHRDGESKLKVSSMGISRELLIKAYYKDNVINVAISGASNSSRPGQTH
jgi:hypothetical protein